MQENLNSRGSLDKTKHTPALALTALIHSANLAKISEFFTQKNGKGKAGKALWVFLEKKTPQNILIFSPNSHHKL